MNENAQLLQHAFQLRKDKKAEEALLIYKPLFIESPAAFGEWDAWSYAQCLKDKQQYAAMLDICRLLYPSFKTSELVSGAYAWAIYYTQLAGDQQPENKAAFIKTLNALVQLSPPGKKYSPTVKSIFKLVKFMSVGNQNDWDEIGAWLMKLEKEHLSIETYTIEGPGRRKMELASELEEWYSWKSKWLLQTRQWEKCVELCDEALTTLNKWHYSNDIWFARRKVASLTQLGHKRQALEILLPLVQRKREWFMLADLAELTTDSEKALKLYAEAAMAYGEPDKKIRVFQKMAASYFLLEQKEAALAHALLVLALRQNNNWPVPEELEQMIKELGGDAAKPYQAAKILQQLKPIWQKMLAGNELPSGKKQVERQEGKIDHLLPAGEAGFIKPATGVNKIYFLFRNYQGNKDEIYPGLLVTYTVSSSFDKKKNRDSVMAVSIKKKL